MRNCRTYSNATSIDLSKYDKRTVGSYYNPPLYEVFKCPDVDGLTRAQKLKFIDAYIKKINKNYFENRGLRNNVILQNHPSRQLLTYKTEDFDPNDPTKLDGVD